MKSRALPALEVVDRAVMTLHEIDPLRDRRWRDLTQRCERSSLFHTTEWLEALRRTYGYQPVAFTNAGPGEPISNALLFCRVNSWLTGKRLVALPFSDHCEPLVESPSMLAALLESLKPMVGPRCRYIEVRPLHMPVNVEGFSPSADYIAHAIDLRPDLGVIEDGLHKNHARRAIRKALRSGVDVEVGRSRELLADFYTLHEMTRRRHSAPIQPYRWFQNLLDCLKDRLTIYMARLGRQPAATILTARHKTTLMFKYGCLDPAYNRLGGTPHLFWRAIEDAKQEGLVLFDLGRSDTDNPGLIAFKDHLGATRTPLTYYRHPPHQEEQQWLPRLASTVYAKTPSRLQTVLSSRLYKHFG